LAATSSPSTELTRKKLIFASVSQIKLFKSSLDPKQTKKQAHPELMNTCNSYIHTHAPHNALITHCTPNSTTHAFSTLSQFIRSMTVTCHWVPLDAFFFVLLLGTVNERNAEQWGAVRIAGSVWRHDTSHFSILSEIACGAHTPATMCAEAPQMVCSTLGL
jgi:hypothetical protein